MVSKIKDFLCYTDPVNIAFGSIIVLLILIMLIFAPWPVIAITVLSCTASVAIVVSGLYLTKLVEKLQAKCHEIPEDEDE